MYRTLDQFFAECNANRIGPTMLRRAVKEFGSEIVKVCRSRWYPKPYRPVVAWCCRTGNIQCLAELVAQFPKKMSFAPTYACDILETIRHRQFATLRWILEENRQQPHEAQIVYDLSDCFAEAAQVLVRVKSLPMLKYFTEVVPNFSNIRSTVSVDMLLLEAMLQAAKANNLPILGYTLQKYPAHAGQPIPSSSLSAACAYAASIPDPGGLRLLISDDDRLDSVLQETHAWLSTAQTFELREIALRGFGLVTHAAESHASILSRIQKTSPSSCSALVAFCRQHRVSRDKLTRILASELCRQLASAGLLSDMSQVQQLLQKEVRQAVMMTTRRF